MSSKDKILRALRDQPMPPLPAPEIAESFGVRYDDPRRQFAEVLAGVGGRAVEVASREAMYAAFEALPVVQAAKKICIAATGWTWRPTNVQATLVDLPATRDPHDLEDVDVAVVPAEFAVAENAAVWVHGKRLAQRAILFIPQHLVVVVPAAEVLHNMHEAYCRLAFDAAAFGAFVSGPSKTADIEQSLVIGAHGPRSHTVFLLQE